MNKNEFLEKLREILSYELPDRIIKPHIRFYSDYIDANVKEGKNQQEVIEDLGDVNLIAKTIIDSEKCGVDGTPGTTDDVDYSKEIYGQGETGAFRSSFFRMGGGSDGYGNSKTYTYGNEGQFEETGSRGADDESGQHGYGQYYEPSGHPGWRVYTTKSFYGNGNNGAYGEPEHREASFGDKVRRVLGIVAGSIILIFILYLLFSVIGMLAPVIGLILIVVLIMKLLG